ncbi:MAG: NosD domain-containing protein [Thermoplasmata archaeon]
MGAVIPMVSEARKFLMVLGIALALIPVSPGLCARVTGECPGVCHLIPFTTNHTITIDANLSEWHADEVLGGNDNAIWYLTWDENKLYLALNRQEGFHGTENDYDVLWIYMDTRDGGSAQSVDWNGRHTLPFHADWCFILRPWNKYWNLREWNGTDWQPDKPYFGVEPAQDWDNGIAEFEIPFGDIGTPLSISVALFLTNGADNYLFGASPEGNPSGYFVALRLYWLYPSLSGNLSPNSSLTASGPLHINGNSEFIIIAQTNGWQGNGTAENPYVIEGYEFNGNGGGYALWIENTDIHFVVRNCKVWNATSQYIYPYGPAIMLSAVSNATIEHNILTQSKYGVKFQGGCKNLKIIGNAVSNAYFGIFGEDNLAAGVDVQSNVISGNNEGVVFYGVQDSRIGANTILLNPIGITLSGCRGICIEGNLIHHNYYHGVYISGNSHNNQLTGNTIASNGNTGITICGGSFANLITYNTIRDNSGYGVALTEASSGNQIYGNNFYRNNGAGKGVNGQSQGYDEVGNAWDDGTGGNYWSNWDGTGTYPIDGSGNAVDRYPQGSPIVGENLSILFWLVVAGTGVICRRVHL